MGKYEAFVHYGPYDKETIDNMYNVRFCGMPISFLLLDNRKTNTYCHFCASLLTFVIPGSKRVEGKLTTLDGSDHSWVEVGDVVYDTTEVLMWDKKSYYEKDGYVIIQNNVNSLEVGSYEIVYQSLADGMLYTRYVEVISRDNKEYFNVDTCTIETFNDYPMILEKSVSLTKNEQILMVRYITDSDKNIGHLYMYYIKNNEIIKEILLFYNQKITVNDLLVDGDDFNEPITDTARGILDGHIMLSRKLGHKNHYPAIDVLQSISRVMGQIATREHKTVAGKLKNVLATYHEAEDLINIGAYKSGSNKNIDYAIEKIDAVNQFLCQDVYEKIAFEESLVRLEALFEN